MANKIYIVNISEELERFHHYHRQYALPGISDALVEAYVNNTIEQMLAHFDIQSVAVQSFIAHYTELITENLSPQYKYHPLKFLKPMALEDYQNYVYCLYGFAEGVYRALVQHGLFTHQGRLLAAYEHIQGGTLHLVIRPEVPDGLYL